MRDGQFVEVARGDPQRPQTFYPMEKFEVAKKGDIMAARCTFDGTRTNKTTTIGKNRYVSSWIPRFGEFVPAVAYHLCLKLPKKFSQPGAHFLAQPCT